MRRYGSSITRVEHDGLTFHWQQHAHRIGEAPVTMVQWLNWPGIKLFFKVVWQPALRVPRLHVESIANVPWEKLKRERNIKAIVLDKDNTFTAPYDLKVHCSVRDAMDDMMQLFGPERIAVLSNSAGTRDDKDYVEAKVVEEAIGLKVIIHDEKKPGGGPDAVLNHFRATNLLGRGTEIKCEHVAMVGDRVLTDVVYGNLNGMYTVLVDPITEKNDNFPAKMIRRMEHRFFLS